MAGEMTQQLLALTALAEDGGVVPAHPVASYNVYNSCKKRSEILFYITSAQGTLWCPYIYEHKTLRH